MENKKTDANVKTFYRVRTYVSVDDMWDVRYEEEQQLVADAIDDKNETSVSDFSNLEEAEEECNRGNYIENDVEAEKTITSVNKMERIEVDSDGNETSFDYDDCWSGYLNVSDYRDEEDYEGSYGAYQKNCVSRGKSYVSPETYKALGIEDYEKYVQDNLNDGLGYVSLEEYNNYKAIKAYSKLEELLKKNGSDKSEIKDNSKQTHRYGHECR